MTIRARWIGLSAVTKVDKATLRQVLNKLAGQGVVRSRRGRQGGFQLAVRPDRLSLEHVANSVEGSTWSKRCLFDSNRCNGTTSCSLAPVWHSVREELLQFARTETIQSVLDNARGDVDGFDIGMLDK